MDSVQEELDSIKQRILKSVEEKLDSELSKLVSVKRGDDSFPGELPFRVIHLIKNPCDNVIRSQQSEYEALKQEHERLKIRLNLLESGSSANITLKVDDMVTKVHKIDQLREKVAEFNARQEKILASLHKTSQELRQAYKLLLGYRIEAFRGSIYKLTSVLTGHELSFKIGRYGDISLIENAHSEKLSEYVQTYLKASNSYPAFLAAITLSSFKAEQHNPAEATVDLSMTMSATMSNTIQPRLDCMDFSRRRSKPVVITFEKPSTQVESREFKVPEPPPPRPPPSDPTKYNIEEVSSLEKKIADLKEQEVKILDSFKKTSREFREVSYLLTGYRIESIRDGILQMSHMYAEHEDDKLIFKIEDEEIQLLENSYTRRLLDFISTYLEMHDSFPCFLAAITLDLFKSSTHSIDMSMEMATTMLPNN